MDLLYNILPRPFAEASSLVFKNGVKKVQKKPETRQAADENEEMSEATSGEEFAAYLVNGKLDKNKTEKSTPDDIPTLDCEA